MWQILKSMDKKPVKRRPLPLQKISQLGEWKK